MITEDNNTPAEEVVPAVPAPEGGAAPVASEGTPAEGGEAAPGEVSGEGLAGDDEKKFSQKDVNRFIAKDKGRARRENRELLDRVSRLEGRGADQVPAPATPQSSFAESEPQEEAYETPGEYYKAVSSWQFRKEQHGANVASQASAADNAVVEMRKEFNRKVDTSGIREKHPDFDDVLEDSGGIFYNDLMEEMVMTSDHTADIAYHLANNPGEAEKIGQMGPVQAAQAIAGLEAKFVSKPPKKTVTGAPDPITPIDGGGGGSPTVDESKLSMDDYAAKKNKEMSY